MFNILKRLIIAQASQKLIGYVSLLIRKCYTSKHIGVDKQVDEAIRFITLNEIYRIPRECMELEYYDEKIINEITERIDNQTRTKFVEIRSEYNDLLQAITYFSEFGEFNFKQIKPLHCLKLYFSAFNNRRKQYKYFKEQNRVKIEIPIEKIGVLIAILTPIFIIEGVFQQFLLANAFNFRMELVLGAQDYLSASITSILYAFVPLVATILLIWLTALPDLSLDPISQRINNNKNYRDFNYYLTIYSVLLLVLFIFNTASFYEFLPMYMAVFICFLGSKYLGKFVKNYSISYTILFFLAFFSLNIFIQTNKLIKEIRSETDTEVKKQLVRIDDINLVKKDLKIVISGSKFIVFYEKSTKKTYLVKPELVKNIELNY